MDLKKFKYIAALMLSAVLILLSVFLITKKSQSETFPRSVAENLSLLYAEKGIYLPQDIIPLTREKYPVYTCNAATADIARTLAETICGAAKSATNLTENGYIFRMDDGSIISVSHSLNVQYSRKGDTVMPSVAYTHTKAPLNMPLDINEELEEYYSDRDVLLAEYLSVSTEKTSSGFAANYVAAINGKEIHGSALTVFTDEAGTPESISGNCYFLPVEAHSYSQQYDQINILTTELASVTESEAHGKTVTAITKCYVTYSGEDGNTVNFLPAWKIVYEDGSFSVYDTVNMAKYIIE